MNRSITKTKFAKGYVGTLAMFLFLLVVWQIASFFYKPLVLPSPVLTFKSFLTIIKEPSLYQSIMITVSRLVTGLFEAFVLGSVIGCLIGVNQHLKSFFEPLIYFIQSTPPILYMTLAMIWFGLDGQATVFIVFLAGAPIMAVNISEGFAELDQNLLQMGKVFGFSPLKNFIHIVLPSLRSYLKSGLLITLSLSWKVVVMGEVLCGGDGLGARITEARLNLETEKVFVYSIVIIIFSYLFQKTASVVLGYKSSEERFNKRNAR